MTIVLAIGLWMMIFRTLVQKHPAGERFRLTIASLFGVWLFYVSGFHSLSNMPLGDPLLFEVHSRFWQQPNVITLTLLGVAIFVLSKEFIILSGGQARNTQLLLVSMLVFYVGFITQKRMPKYTQRMNSFTEDYGKAILAELPRNALLVVNYDMQWTSIRYATVCENYRSDVTVLDSPMLSFEWFQHYHRLYPNATFPGTHLTPQWTVPHANGGFSWQDFLESNVPYGGPIQHMADSFPTYDRVKQHVLRYRELKSFADAAIITSAERLEMLSYRRVPASGVFFAGAPEIEETLSNFTLVPYGMTSVAVREDYIKDHHEHVRTAIEGSRALAKTAQYYAPPKYSQHQVSSPRVNSPRAYVTNASTRCSGDLIRGNMLRESNTG
eukprot:gb/GECG01015371.1/.p1 GENE.gb/GECG01015371.1/~~gb/GECG01015371.1/.p1  ORF type:complete len:383 (+),score=11.22 gb/GECG01015371.1/:1-1149(+)